jgi:hypothetical protein
MKIEKVLNFEDFLKINEAEESGVIGAADQIVNLFFLAYDGIVTKIGEYKDSAKDGISVAEAEPEDKGKAILDVMTKVANQVNPKYKEAANEMILAAKRLKEAYETLIATEDGKKQLEKISDKIYKKIISQQNSLKTAVSQAPKIEVKDNNSEVYDYGSALFEKVFDKTFTEERKELAKKITPIYSTVVDLAQNSPSDALKAECIKIAGDLKGYLDELASENEAYWEKKKRSERKDRLREINKKVNLIPSELQKIQTKALMKLGIDKKVQEAITSASEAIKNAMDILNTEEESKIEASAEKKSEEAKNDSEKKEVKSEEKSDEGGKKEGIKSGNVDVTNLKKSGKNRETIRSYQKKINLALPADSKIDEDGLYGKNTESAIKKIAAQYSPIAPELKGLNGKEMTPAFINFLEKFEKNRDKIADLFK